MLYAPSVPNSRIVLAPMDLASRWSSLPCGGETWIAGRPAASLASMATSSAASFGASSPVTYSSNCRPALLHDPSPYAVGENLRSWLLDRPRSPTPPTSRFTSRPTTRLGPPGSRRSARRLWRRSASGSSTTYTTSAAPRSLDRYAGLNRRVMQGPPAVARRPARRASRRRAGRGDGAAQRSRSRSARSGGCSPGCR